MTVQLCTPQKDASGIWIAKIGAMKLGLSPQSEWSLQLKEKTHALATPQDMVFALPLLEAGRPAIYLHLQAAAGEMPEIGVQLMAFPEALLLQCAFEEAVSDYWPIKGIEWLDSCPSLADRFADMLRDLQKRPWATQTLKQKIRSMLKNR